ncbi:nucleoside monophosphate kinase [Candidatus Saccharibacteria bacterium]|nr:nucleoside monophosphate kinase [Candidatus Saccharibacteria bacterium]
MEEKIEKIKSWLGTGSINIFGLPMSGKDTVGVRLAEMLDAKFLSSGIIIRAIEEQEHLHYTEKGNLWPTDMFRERILPYLGSEELVDYPLVLSSVGRWQGEEDAVMEAAENAGHPIKAVISLNVSESDVMNRWRAAKELQDRGERKDDQKEETFQQRILEFRNKTLPVLQHYQNLGLLLSVNADASRDEVFNNVIEVLYSRSQEG